MIPTQNTEYPPPPDLIVGQPPVYFVAKFSNCLKRVLFDQLKDQRFFVARRQAGILLDPGGMRIAG